MQKVFTVNWLPKNVHPENFDFFYHCMYKKKSFILLTMVAAFRAATF